MNFVRVGGVWINLAHVAFVERRREPQGTFSLCVHLALPIVDEELAVSTHAQIAFYGDQARQFVTTLEALQGIESARIEQTPESRYQSA